MSFNLIYDKFHDNIELSNLEVRFLNSPIINRLHRILQNSTAYLVFPNCKTSRFEHSIGTMNFASSIFINGIQNSNIEDDYLLQKLELIQKYTHTESSDIFSSLSIDSMNASQYEHIIFEKLNVNTYGELLKNNQVLKQLKDLIGSNFIKRNIKTKDESEPEKIFVQLVLLQTLRLHGLMHDVGHLPFSHLFEFSLETIHNDLEGNNESESNKFILSKIKSAYSSKGTIAENDEIHEIISENISKFIFADIKKNILDDSEDDLQKAINFFLTYIIQKCWEEVRKGRYGELNSLYSIVSDTLEADRLDYIQRDGAMSGIIKSTANIDRIVKMFILVKSPDEDEITDEFVFLPSIQSLHDIEEILQDRYTIYKYMVNHHAVKRSDYLLQRAIELIIRDEITQRLKFSKEPKVNLLIDIIRIIAGLTTDQIDKYYRKVFYEFTQINDYWLITKLSEKYIDLVIKQDNSNLTNILAEIFENRKKFKSLWKRKFEYYSFSRKLGERLNKEYKKLRNFKTEYITSRANIKYTELKTTLDKFENNNDELFATLGFILVDFIKANYKENWARKIENKINSENHSILIAPYRNKTGIKKNLYLVDNKNTDDIKTLSEVSNIETSLTEDLKTSTRFFVYYKCSENNKRQEVQQIIEDAIFEVFEEIIK